MSQAAKKKLFQSFSQADASTTRKFGGTGLGLVISKNLTQLMGGEIWIESEEGVGSCFHFTAMLGKQEGEASKRRSIPSALGALNVLVVDDNGSAREIFGNMLAGFGLRVDQANSGEAALRQIENFKDNKPYDLVLMDWKMPGLDGIETTRKLQSKKNSDHIPLVIMVTAYGREEVMQAMEGLDISSVLTKPVTPSALLDSVMLAMGHAVASETNYKPRHKELTDNVARLNNAYVLLVEDNEVNQELALELLLNNGIRVEVANDGQEAIDWLEKVKFDGVLMDCQMPVMDGYCATKKLREQKRFKDLPILAMTANAMVGDKEKVIRAGMNDHIAKPIDVGELFKVMAKWITPSQPGMKPVISDQANQQGSEIAIPPLAGINVDAGLDRTQGNRKLYLKLLNKFYESQADFVERFKASLTSKDKTESERCAHSLKGVAGNIGAETLMKEAALLEQVCSHHSSGKDMETRLSLVEQSLSQALASISSIPSSNESNFSSEGELDDGQFNELLKKLKNCLKEDDTLAIDVVDELHKLPGIHKHSLTLKKLTKSIESYDFELGLEVLKELTLT